MPGILPPVYKFAVIRNCVLTVGVDDIVARAARDVVSVPVARLDKVVAGAADQEVLAGSTEDLVIALTAHYDIAARGGIHYALIFGSNQIVFARRA